MLFRFEGMVAQKHVADFLIAMAALKTYNVICVPVTGAKATEEGEVAETPGTTLADKITAKLRELPPHTEVSRKTMFGWATAMSYTPNSILVTQLVKAKVLKKSKTRGVFVVTPPAK